VIEAIEQRHIRPRALKPWNVFRPESAPRSKSVFPTWYGCCAKMTYGAGPTSSCPTAASITPR
jgi:hypothetical protein